MANHLRKIMENHSPILNFQRQFLTKTIEKESEVKENDSNKDSSCNTSNDVSEETNESITSIEESSEIESGEDSC